MRAALRPASFRGLAFHVEASTGRDGRRLAVHEYPGRDL
ncbi:DNA circularization N-terminal domain-containing protein, partial [Arenibaculum sp.]